jgi:hypothetical protein
MRRPTVLSVLPVLIVLTVLSAAPLAAQAPVGPEISVNQNPDDGPSSPDVGMAADGSFVIVWEGEHQGRIRLRRYRASGKPNGGELRVSRLGDRQQAAPAVAVRPDGSFVVVWNRIAAGGKRVEVYASLFTAGAQAIGKPRLVGFAGRASAGEPAAVTVLPDGGFFVAWTLEDGEPPSRDLYGRRFTRAGVPVGGRVTLNADPLGDQRHPECAVSQGRELVCTWTSHLEEGGSEIRFRRFDLKGLPLGDEVRVDEEDTAGHPQRYSSLGVREDGTVLVTWVDSGSAERVLGRVLDASGGLAGPAVVLGVTNQIGGGPPRAAATGGGFAVVWCTLVTAGGDLLLSEVSADGVVTGAARVIDQRPESYPVLPAIAFGPGGGAVVWSSLELVIRGSSIVARRLR